MRTMKWRPRYFDIGVNFSDGMFQGTYFGSDTPKHPPDADRVIAKAQLFNVDKMLITASSIKESSDHFALVRRYKGAFGSTVGVHPCTVAEEFYGGRDSEVPLANVDEKLSTLREIAREGAAQGLVKAFGEIGLDYDRLHYSTAAQQREMFARQLDVYAQLKLKLPLFLHMRAACDDFVAIIQRYLDDGSIERGNGVVHSFTGTADELAKILDLGFFVGVNGCSLKTDENLEVARMIPREKLLIETDAPWCELRKTSPAHKYIVPYPNIFCPEIPDYDPSKEGLDEQGKPLSLKLSARIKLDDYLPFPLIKKEKYAKHMELVQAKLGDNAEAAVGELAHPFIKSRNEPIFVTHVAMIMAALHGLKSDEEIQQFVDQIYANSCTLFDM